jgi:hypothetical protein
VRRVAFLVAAALLSSAVPLVAASPAAAAGDDTVQTFGFVSFRGSTRDLALNQPVIDMAGTPSGDGYWLVASDGGVFSFGDARFHGSMGATRLNQPILGIEPTPTGRGYWLFAGDGGVFSFGDARFYGSTGAMVLNRPIVDMIAVPDGRGYWLVASDGGVFSFGSARFHGSTGALRLVSPIVAAEAAPDGRGYWLVAGDGGVFTFGSARFLGSAAGLGTAPVVDIAATPRGRGYWIAASDGRVFEFGAASHWGEAAGSLPLDRQVVAIESPWRHGYRLAISSRPGFFPEMGPGATGPAVASLQRRLTELGYWLGAVDGSYGLLTTQAVTAFQKVHGLARTGVVDPATQLALVGAQRPRPRSTSGYLIEVDKARQVVIVARNGVAEWVLNTSTGTERPYTFEGRTYLADTPPGVWTIFRQVDGIREGELGTLIRPKYFHADGIAFHGYPSVPPYPASHGCVRLTLAAMDWVWENDVMPLGTRVWVY